MSHATIDKFRRFRTKGVGADKAQAFQHAFYRKFGSIDGQNYLCSETAIVYSSGDRYITRLGFIPWPYPIAADDRVDFDRLIAEAGAVAC